MKKLLTLATILFGLVAAAQAGSSHATIVQGCLIQSQDGNFKLANDSTGAPEPFQLRGDTALLNDYVDKEVRISGVFTTNDASNPDSMPMSMAMASTGAAELNVKSVDKINNNCKYYTTQTHDAGGE